MISPDIDRIHQQQKEYFATHATKPMAARVAALTTLKQVIREYEPRLIQAMAEDFGKPEIESATAEIWAVLKEIDYILKNLKRWMRPRRARTPLLHTWAASYIHSEPYGQVLIIAPWTYPFLLLFSPLLGAVAAGNVAILKPSEHAPNTAAVIEDMINPHFDPGLLHVINGGVETSQALSHLPFDYIFFTGSTRVGKLVMKAAAEHLTPVTLEMGGKSPALVDATADLEIAATRIVWGKFYNAGQTCIAPDYLLVHRSVHDELMSLMLKKVTDFYGADPLNNPDLSRIIDCRHFRRLRARVDPAKVVYGGRWDEHTRSFAPTIMDGVAGDDPVMQEEIFGPILPVLTYDTLDEAFAVIHQHPNPLSLYVFTRDKAVERQVINEVPFGGGCVNDVISHFVSTEIPFGGRGASGMGSYHGKRTFDTFSHNKSIIYRANRPDVRIRYPPYRIGTRAMRVIFAIANWLV